MNGAGLEELNEDIYDLSPCGFFTSRHDGIIVKVNETFVRMTGYSREELLNNMRWQDLLTMGGKIYHETHYVPLLNLQGVVKEINFDLLRKDGAKIPVLINTAQGSKNEGRVLLNHSSVLDISQRKQFEMELMYAKKQAEELVEKLKATNTELEQFAYVVSHDLQAPLGAIKASIQILQLKNEGVFDAESGSICAGSLESVNRMSILIKELLEYSRMDNRQAPHVQVDLNEVWRYVCRTFERSIEEYRAQINVPELPSVIGNKTQLIRLFQNLLSNSLKYRSSHPPEISIRVVRGEQLWKFFFTDNGIGFDQKDTAKIFNFFQRLDNTGTVSGTGIGLAATKKIVEMHGGEISAISEAGKGSTFIFTLVAADN
jgi:PAS domain S-box-containing protein